MKRHLARHSGMTFLCFGVLACLCFFSMELQAQAAKQKYVHFKWVKIADGVWHGVTPPHSFIGSNTMIVALPSGGSLVVDAHITGYTAREIIAKAREVAGPVKYLVNTHFHNDRAQGNYAFREAFPDVQIIAHRYSCFAEEHKAVGRSNYRLTMLPKDLEVMRANLSKVPTAEMKAALERLIAGNEVYLADFKDFHWVFPNVCLDLSPGEGMTIRDGQREIQILYFGRAHTAGDLVVYLPKEKILFSGALWTESGRIGGFGRDGSGLEYPETLRRIEALDIDWVLPGGGEPFRGKKGLRKSIVALENLIEKVKESYGRGEYIEQTLAELAPPPRTGGPTLADFVPYLSPERYGPNAAFNRTVIRIYEELEYLNQRGMPIP